MKVYQDLKEIMVDFNLQEAFQALVLECGIGNESDKRLFNEKKLRESPSFQELPSGNFTLDQLSIRRLPLGSLGSTSKNNMI
jgi:hypothetical protein